MGVVCVHSTRPTKVIDPKSLARILPTFVVLAFAISITVFLIWNNRVETISPANHDPRLSYSGPFQNIHPSVQYVGDHSCIGCHDEHIESFAKHPMGQALATMADATTIEKYDIAAKNPFVANGFRYQISSPADGAQHQEDLEFMEGPSNSIGKSKVGITFHRQMKARFAVGSGAKARSYLMELDGFLFQSPCTWYKREARWDLSPSFEVKNQHFSRSVTAGCLFCHSNRADPVEGTENRFREPIFHGLAIGCERCHGPGEKHVQKQLEFPGKKGADERMDPTIVNPKWLDHSLRQAICEQCHVQGEQRVVGRGLGDFDFRPGLPLHSFLMDFVDQRHKDGGFKFVSSVEQMMQSRCYQATTGNDKMGCTSCHDPHSLPETPKAKLEHYRTRCLNCHQSEKGQTSCSLPSSERLARQRDDNCITCHMPQNSAEVNHASITDHAIPRKPKPFMQAGHRPTPGPHDLAPFHGHLIEPDDPEAQRNLGLARMAMFNLGLPPKLAVEMAAAALGPLGKAIERDPNDWPAVEAHADALLLNGRGQEAMVVYRMAVNSRPNFEKTRFGAGAVAMELGLLDEAIEHLSAAVRINPYHPGYQHDLALAMFRKGDFAGAEKACRTALQQEPSREKTRSLLILALLRSGRDDLAAFELDILKLTTSENKQPDLIQWYANERIRASSGK